ncbi:MAG: structural protein [Bacteriophage sp.]|nr:MAG: structural protein [Bacteriophage sp.]
MIDTIVLRVHNIPVNHLLMNDILKQDFVQAKMRHDRGETLDQKSILYGDSNKILPLHIHMKMKIASSHYTLNLRPNFERDFIEFNFSIPKFIYSTNTFQFIDRSNYSPEFTHDKLLHFLHDFFSKYFTVIPEKKYIEINRIDLCYNQIFESKENALRYLEEQKNINIVNARSDKNKFTSFVENDDLGQQKQSSIMYVTKNYSFKIYHKGTEFAKNDLKQLLKKNPLKLHLGEISELADRMLRYELTARKGLFNYLLDRVIDNYNPERVQFLKKCNLKYKKKGVQEITQSYSFFLESDFDCYIDYKCVTLEQFVELQNNTFTKNLFVNLWDFFWEKVKVYQISLKLNVADISKMIMEKYAEEKNTFTLQEQKKELGNQSQLITLALLTQFTDVSSLKGVIPDRTFYRYKKRLQELGIKPHSHTNLFDIPILNYDKYFDCFSKYLNISY